MTTAELADRLVCTLREMDSVAVAFSGGVDSAVVARAAAEALGQQAVAITAVSPSLAMAELQTARQEAAHIGIRHVEISTQEFERPEYRANAGDRCFYCKETLYSLAKEKLSELGVCWIVNGANADDLGDHRPGMQAARLHHVRSPLIELGINKRQVRQLATFWQLSVAEKPASPCLSSRIAYGVEVTPERVQRIELAEAFLKSMISERELRVRLEAGDIARIELPLTSFSELMDDSVRSAVTSEFRRLVFSRITLDLEGFRSGSMNDSLPLVALSVGN